MEFVIKGYLETQLNIFKRRKLLNKGTVKHRVGSINPKKLEINGSGRNLGIEGLRSLAMISILAYHLLPNKIVGGHIGVLVFFIITGFFTLDYMLRHKPAIKELGSYLLKRIWSISLPLLVVTSIVSFFVFVFNKPLLSGLRGDFLSANLFYNNWWQIASGNSYFDKFLSPSVFSHLWFLSVQMQFVIVATIICFIVININRRSKDSGRGRWQLFLIMGALMLLSMLYMAFKYRDGQDPTGVYYSTLTRSYTLLMGSLLAILSPGYILGSKGGANIIKWNLYLKNTLGILVLFLWGYGVFHFSAVSSFSYRGGFIILSILSLLLVVAAAQKNTILNMVLSSSLLVAISKRSYILYLWQYSIGVLYETMARGLGLSSNKGIFFQILITIILSEITYQSIRFCKNKARGDMKQKIIIALIFIIIIGAGLTGVVSGAEREKDAGQMQLELALRQKSAGGAKLTRAMAILIVQGASDHRNISKTQKRIGDSLEITFLGDSVLLATEDYLKDYFPAMISEGDVGRQFYSAPEKLQEMENAGELKKVVVLVLGNNGTITEDDFAQVMKVIGKKRMIFAVNMLVPRSWEEGNNRLLEKMGKKYPNLHIIHWHSKAKEHTEWLYGDGVHPNPDGAKIYAEFVAHEILKVIEYKKNIIGK